MSRLVKRCHLPTRSVHIMQYIKNNYYQTLSIRSIWSTDSNEWTHIPSLYPPLLYFLFLNLALSNSATTLGPPRGQGFSRSQSAIRVWMNIFQSDTAFLKVPSAVISECQLVLLYSIRIGAVQISWEWAPVQRGHCLFWYSCTSCRGSSAISVHLENRNQ